MLDMNVNELVIAVGLGAARLTISLTLPRFRAWLRALDMETDR